MWCKMVCTPLDDKNVEKEEKTRKKKQRCVVGWLEMGGLQKVVLLREKKMMFLRKKERKI